MSFTTNSSNLSGKSTTNAFDIIANSLTVNKNTLCKGDLTVLGNTNIGNVTLENANVDNLTVNNLTATNPIPITSGGTGLATIGSPNQVLTVNPAGTALIYTAGLINPVTIVGTGFTGTPTFNFGIETDTGSLGRGFIRTGPTATSGLVLGTSSATVLRLWSNFSTDSNAEITNTNANFTYNSTGSSGVFQVLNNGGGISFTNSGIGTISMATAGGAITLADPTSLSGAVSISTAGGIFNLATGAGATNITTLAGNMNLSTGAGAISLTTGLGNINLTTAAAGIISLTTATAGAINIGATVGLVNIYGSAVTLGAPVIYIGTGSAVPIPSVVTFACGAVNGISGAWAITTAAFQLNSFSISLNSTSTIALNNNSTVAGSLSVTGSSSSLTSSLFTVTNTNTIPQFTGSFLAPNISSNNSVFLGLGKSLTSTESAFLQFTNSAIPSSTYSIYGSTTSINQIYNGNISLTAPSTNINGILNVINGNIFTNQNIIEGITIINNGNLALSSSSPGIILIRGGSGSIITLPNATTLIEGYSYTINNNSSNPATINQFTSGTVGTVAPGNLATVICINTSSANGQWDLHISGSNTDWANPGTIGSATPNTGAFTTLTASSVAATGIVRSNSGLLNSTTTTNPGVYVYGSIHGMDLGYSATTSRYSTRIFCVGDGAGDIALSSAVSPYTSQSNFTDRLVINGSTGVLTASGSSSSLTSSAFTYSNTNTAPQFTGAFLTPNIALNSTMYLGFGKSISSNNSAFLDFTSATSSTSRWSIYGSTTAITQTYNGPISAAGTSTSLTSSFFNVVNSSTNPQMTGAFLAPSMLNNNNIFLAVGKALSGTNCTFLQYNTNSVLSYARWSIYDSSTSIEQIYNGKITLNGNTDINGTLTVPTLKSSSTVYNSSTSTAVGNASWTNIDAITVFRQKGSNPLTWINQATGFRNTSSVSLLVTASFSCQRSANAFGVTAIRILGGGGEGLGVQDASALDAVTITGNTFVDPNQTIQCQIFQNSGSTVSYQNVFITINTSPFFP